MNIFTRDIPQWLGMVISASMLIAMLYFRYSIGV